MQKAEQEVPLPREWRGTCSRANAYPHPLVHTHSHGAHDVVCPEPPSTALAMRRWAPRDAPGSISPFSTSLISATGTKFASSQPVVSPGIFMPGSQQQLLFTRHHELVSPGFPGCPMASVTQRGPQGSAALLPLSFSSTTPRGFAWGPQRPPCVLVYWGCLPTVSPSPQCPQVWGPVLQDGPHGVCQGPCWGGQESMAFPTHSPRSHPHGAGGGGVLGTLRTPAFKST